MFAWIGNFFKNIQKVLAVFGMVVTMIELLEPEEPPEKKREDAIKKLQEAFTWLRERAQIPEWAEVFFFTREFAEWIIGVLVQVAHRIRFFLHKEEREEVEGGE